MNLIEKKCPNCGAHIDFNPEDKEIECNYCHTKFDVEKDSSEAILDTFNLHAKNVRKISTLTFIIIGVITIIMMIFIFLIFSNVFKSIPRP